MNISELTLSIEKVAAQQRISRDFLVQVDAHEDFLTGDILVRMQRQIAAYRGQETVEVPEIRVPASWWDAFKERHFDVLLRWFPVRYRVLQRAAIWRAYEMLPAVKIPDNYRHGAFAVFQQEGPFDDA